MGGWIARRAKVIEVTRFESTLALAGYSPVHDEEYSKLRLRAVAEELFAVRDAFPRLTPASFPSGVPTGIERVDYEINLSGSGELRLARAPAESPAL